MVQEFKTKVTVKEVQSRGDSGEGGLERLKKNNWRGGKENRRKSV